MISERKRVSQITYMHLRVSTIDAFRKANEESPMDIVFVEDTTDNCGLRSPGISERKNKELLSTFSGNLLIGLFTVMNIERHII